MKKNTFFSGFATLFAAIAFVVLTFNFPAKAYFSTSSLDKIYKSNINLKTETAKNHLEINSFKLDVKPQKESEVNFDVKSEIKPETKTQPAANPAPEPQRTQTVANNSQVAQPAQSSLPKSESSQPVTPVNQPTEVIEQIQPQQQPEVIPQQQLQANQSQIKSEVKSTSNLLSIPKIALENVELKYGTIDDIPDVDQKLLLGPVVENTIAPDICSSYGNSYIFGHSEPAAAAHQSYPGVYVFANLDLLQNGDMINFQTADGQTCSYAVYRTDSISTTNRQTVAKSLFNEIFYPSDVPGPSLTLQTCVKGSTTDKLLIRAVKVQ